MNLSDDIVMIGNYLLAHGYNNMGDWALDQGYYYYDDEDYWYDDEGYAVDIESKLLDAIGSSVIELS